MVSGSFPDANDAGDAGAALDRLIHPVASRCRIAVALAVCTVLALLYWYGWGDGIAAAIRDLTGGAGPKQPGVVTVDRQLDHLRDNVALTVAAAAVFLTLRYRACGFAFVPPVPVVPADEERGGPAPVRLTRESWNRWWRTGFAYCFCMLAGFAAIDVASALIRTPFYDYPFATRYENGLAAVLYCVNMFFAGPTEELVLLGIVVIGLRHAGVPWWLVLCVAVGLRVPFHLYYGWAAFAIAVWPVLAVLLYRRVGMITPLIVAHGMYDVSTAMTNLTGIAGSPWPLAVALAIMAAPLLWLLATLVSRLRRRFGPNRH